MAIRDARGDLMAVINDRDRRLQQLAQRVMNDGGPRETALQRYMVRGRDTGLFTPGDLKAYGEAHRIFLDTTGMSEEEATQAIRVPQR